MKSTTRDQVMAEMVRVSREASAEGRDGMKAIQAAFPDVPAVVASEAWCIGELDDVEDWWQSVEKTIDGEIIRRAIGGAL